MLRIPRRMRRLEAATAHHFLLAGGLVGVSVRFGHRPLHAFVSLSPGAERLVLQAPLGTSGRRIQGHSGHIPSLRAVLACLRDARDCRTGRGSTPGLLADVTRATSAVGKVDVHLPRESGPVADTGMRGRPRGGHGVGLVIAHGPRLHEGLSCRAHEGRARSSVSLVAPPAVGPTPQFAPRPPAGIARLTLLRVRMELPPALPRQGFAVLALAQMTAFLTAPKYVQIANRFLLQPLSQHRILESFPPH
mmetsp:Transcript_60580/g.179574  ORF Transcript_60580/g.179574 Transcript_60580/m.179574 type:complete len:248 (+) Transcript_60580:2319-3062(+)